MQADTDFGSAERTGASTGVFEVRFGEIDDGITHHLVTIVLVGPIVESISEQSFDVSRALTALLAFYEDGALVLDGYDAIAVSAATRQSVASFNRFADAYLYAKGLVSERRFH